MNSKGSFPRIIIAFFILCSSILLITHGELLSLAGVYTIAFLGVMTLFAIGNLILKETRTELKRTYSAPILMVVPAFLATTVGIVGNIRIDQTNLTFFEMYFIPSVALVLVIVYQDYILKFLKRITQGIPRINDFITRNFNDMVEGKFIVFINNTSRIYEILDYVNRNETGWNVILVHCGDRESYKEIQDTLPVLKMAGVHPHLNITSYYEPDEFGPEVIDKVSKKFNVRKNRILIGSIHHFHKFDYDELGGVRIIF
jgi:hypothetical protein